jgi:hypothetical protein
LSKTPNKNGPLIVKEKHGKNSLKKHQRTMPFETTRDITPGPGNY